MHASARPALLSLAAVTAVATAALAGCAATSTLGAGAEPAPRTGVRLDLVPDPAADAAPTFPALHAAQLPSAARLTPAIRAELGDTASLAVRLCVGAPGDVRSVEVTRGSRLAALDAAVITDAAGWRFAALPGPATAQTCAPATIVYRP